MPLSERVLSVQVSGQVVVLQPPEAHWLQCFIGAAPLVTVILRIVASLSARTGAEHGCTPGASKVLEGCRERRKACAALDCTTAAFLDRLCTLLLCVLERQRRGVRCWLECTRVHDG